MSDDIDLKSYVKAYMDFPKKGINFYDATELLNNPKVFNLTIKKMTQLALEYNPDRIVAIDSKGFLIGAPIAYSLGLGLSLIRKEGKLPKATKKLSYDLEYDKDTIEIRGSDFNKNERIVVVDDVLASGGTLAASVEILQQIGVDVVGSIAVIEIGFLNGRKKINSPVSTLLYYDR